MYTGFNVDDEEAPYTTSPSKTNKTESSPLTSIKEENFEIFSTSQQSQYDTENQFEEKEQNVSNHKTSVSLSKQTEDSLKAIYIGSDDTKVVSNSVNDQNISLPIRDRTGLKICEPFKLTPLKLIK